MQSLPKDFINRPTDGSSPPEIVAPVTLFVFNRPAHTRKVFESIRRQRPPKLYLIADGPRPEVPSDLERCGQVREILENVDWDCEVERNYSDMNLGGPTRIPTGLDWVLKDVNATIVLEDDCLPGDDFFRFMTIMLDRFKDNNRVWAVTGNNFQGGARHGQASYFFSKYCLCWGWATWRRAWEHYIDGIPYWQEMKSSSEWNVLMSESAERYYWSSIFERIYSGEIRHWDYHWMARIWYAGALTVTPNMNLVSNIGFCPDATNTIYKKSQSGVPIAPLGQIIHTNDIQQCEEADQITFNRRFNEWRMRWWGRSLLRLGRPVKAQIHRFIKTNF